MSQHKGATPQIYKKKLIAQMFFKSKIYFRLLSYLLIFLHKIFFYVILPHLKYILIFL